MACLVGMAIVGCGAPSPAAQSPGHGVPVHELEVAQIGAAKRPATTTPVGTPLYARFATGTALGATGQALTASLGGVTYRGATGVWVGCEGTASTALFGLGGEFSTLTGVLGLQPHTPAALAVRVSVIVDGDTRLTRVLRRDTPPVTVSVPVGDARSVTVAALATEGECAPAPAPYGAIGAASLI